jgi:hypothetical protein
VAIQGKPGKTLPVLPFMPLPDPELMYRLVRRHTHDLRNHCSGIDLDATLLGELSTDPEVAAMALRLKRQVARIESDIKFLLLKLEESNPVTVSVGDLLQLWRMKLQPLTTDTPPIAWPDISGPSVTLDSRLVVQVLCDLTLRAWDRNPALPMEVQVRRIPEQVVIELIQTPDGFQAPVEYLNDTAALLMARGLQLIASTSPSGTGWKTSLLIPLTEKADS